MKTRITTAMAAIALMAFVACDETTDTLGNSLTADADKFVITTDTFNVKTESIIIDSVLTSGSNIFLGKVRDPETHTDVTGHFATNMYANRVFDDTKMILDTDSITSKDSNGNVKAVLSYLTVFFESIDGDSLTPMQITVHELLQPLNESAKYYSNYNPEKENIIRNDGYEIVKKFNFTPLDLNLSDSLRNEIVSGNDYAYINVPLTSEYRDKEGNTYNNYGTYLLRQAIEHPEYTNNIYDFSHNVCPGFYIKTTNGLGAMMKIRSIQVQSVYEGISEGDTVNIAYYVSSTDDVAHIVNIENDRNSINSLAQDNSCTYLKTPAGIFTEVTLPVDEIKFGHENDTISSAKVVFRHYNTQSDNALNAPTEVLIMPKDSLYSFFENKSITDYKTSFLATYSSSTNSYTFNNISNMIGAMYDAKKSGKATADWNKAVLVPVSINYTSTTSMSSYYNTSSSQRVTGIDNCLKLTSAKLVKGEETDSPVKISVIYNKQKQ